jgi:uncharacterized membrane protein
VAGDAERHVPDGSHEAAAIERIVFFSDAVMAIAITLLAIDLRLPIVAGATDQSFMEQLVGLAPKYLAFVISFAVIGVYWIAHHRMFRFVVAWDGGLLALNLLYLFFVVQLPFVASALGNYASLPSATAVYALGLSLMGFSSLLLWVYALRRHLVVPNMSPQFKRYVALRAGAVATVFIASVPLAFISPLVAQGSWLAISATLFAFRRRFAPVAPAPAERAS